MCALQKIDHNDWHTNENIAIANKFRFENALCTYVNMDFHEYIQQLKTINFKLQLIEYSGKLNQVIIYSYIHWLHIRHTSLPSHKMIIDERFSFRNQLRKCSEQMNLGTHSKWVSKSGENSYLIRKVEHQSFDLTGRMKRLLHSIVEIIISIQTYKHAPAK